MLSAITARCHTFAANKICDEMQKSNLSKLHSNFNLPVFWLIFNKPPPSFSSYNNNLWPFLYEIVSVLSFIHLRQMSMWDKRRKNITFEYKSCSIFSTNIFWAFPEISVNSGKNDVFHAYLSLINFKRFEGSSWLLAEVYFPFKSCSLWVGLKPHRRI